MRKSIWLLSAGFVAISAPAFAQETQGSTSTAAEGPTEAAAVDAGRRGGRAARRLGHHRHRDAAQRSVERRSAGRIGSHRRDDAEYRRGRHPRPQPGFAVAASFSRRPRKLAQAVANIRGIGTVGDNPGLESSVAVFIDGVYRSRTGVGLTELGPIDRVEVLRGPQGTLFGRNASAGLIHVITAKPRFTREIYGEASLGNYDLRRIELGATGPITDTLAARIDGVWMQRDGFLDDVISGGDYNDRNRYMVRGQLLYQPNDDLSVRLIADYAKRNEQCCAAVYQPTEDKQRTSVQSYASLPSTIERIFEG